MAKRYSRQRELILNYLKTHNNHPTAKAIYNAIQKDNPSLSLGTVYRNLRSLEEEGELRRLPLNVERYDGNTEQHSHFVCNKCNTVFDIDLKYDTKIDETVADEVGGDVCKHDIIFYGCCENCLKIKA